MESKPRQKVVHLQVSRPCCVALTGTDDQHCVRRQGFQNSTHSCIGLSNHCFFRRVLLLTLFHLQSNGSALSAYAHPIVEDWFLLQVLVNGQSTGLLNIWHNPAQDLLLAKVKGLAKGRENVNQ